MANAISSTGKCIFCGKEFSKRAISRHLAGHLQQLTKAGKPGKSVHLKIETDPRWGSTPYFLHLWVDGDALVDDVDHFLRAIWLECCGHMSSFTKKQAPNNRGGVLDFWEAEELLAKGKTREYEKLMEETRGEIPKSKKVKDALRTDAKIDYQYDFGSTTALLITVLAEYPIAAAEDIVLLSRNKPLREKCSMCGDKTATEICMVHMNDFNAVFCKACAKKHAKVCDDFADYASMPVVNSPRLGVCAYEGGTIDVERDR